MFKLPKSSFEKSELQNVRTAAIAGLEGKDPDSEEYKKIMAHVETLSKLISAESREKLSPNTLAIVLGNFSVAGLILWYERDNVMNTKLFPFLHKPKS